MRSITLSFETIWKGLVALCAGIVTIAGCASACSKLFSPFRTLKKQVAEHDELLKRDHSRLKAVEKSDVYLCKAMLALLDHAATGNSIDRIKRARDELQTFLAEN